MNAVSTSRYALGALGVVVVLAGPALAAVACRRRWLAGLQGAPALLAEVVLGLAVLTGVPELLGAVGLFRFWPVVLACAIVGAVAAWRMPQAVDVAERPSVWWPGVWIVAGAAGVVFAEWAAPTLQSYDVGIRTFDSLWYHLPWAATFAQSGHITPLHFTDVEYLTPFYPASAELYHGLGIVLLSRDTLSPGFNLIWLGLVLFAAYCVGRPHGLGPAALLGAALALATPMMVLSQAGSAANDIVAVFFLLASVALVHLLEDRPVLVVAALAAGLAVGVKLTVLAPVAALTVGVVWLAPARARARTGLVWIGVILLAGGFWYARNLIAVGNPLPWLDLPLLSTPAHALQQDTGFSLAHYLLHTHYWTAVFGPGLRRELGPWWPAVLAFVLTGPILCVAGGDRRLRVLGLVALAALAAYLVTPETAAGPTGDPVGFALNLRYAAPALVLSLTLLPLAPCLRSPLARGCVLSGLFVALIATVARGQLWPSRHVLGVVLVGAFVAGFVALWAARPAWRLAVVSTLAVAAVLFGHGWQRHYLRGRYQYNPGVSYLAHVWALFKTVHHARVGVVGTFGGFFAYPLYGGDDSNRVSYVGARGPHGSFSAVRSCRAWRAAVNAGDYRFLVTTPARDPWHPKPLHPSPEAGWTASDPAAHLIYSRTATGQLISVFRLSGRLNPALCPVP